MMTVLLVVIILPVAERTISADGVSLARLLPYESWKNDNNNITTENLSGFSEVSETLAQNWTGASTTHTEYIIYKITGNDHMYLAKYVNGGFSGLEDRSITKHSLFYNIDNYYYTTGIIISVTGVSLSPNTNQAINLDDVISFTASVSPNNATDNKVKWSIFSTADSIALYSDPECNNAVTLYTATETTTVYAKGITAGNAIVKVESNADANKSASCNVTVENKYTVTFNPAKGIPFIQNVEKDDYATTPSPAPTNGDWKLRGWYLTPVDISKGAFDFGGTAITGKITLEAVWESGSDNGSDFTVESNDPVMGKVGHAKTQVGLSSEDTSVSFHIIKTYDDDYYFKAYPNDNYRFVKWVDAEDKTVSTDQTLNHKCNAKEKLTAVFEEEVLSIDLGVTEGGVVTVYERKDSNDDGKKIGEVKGKGTGNFATKENLLYFIATPEKGYIFTCFYDGEMKNGHIERQGTGDYNSEKSIDRSEKRCFEAVFEKYFYPTAGNNQTWIQGSGNSLSVTFDLKEGEGDPFDRFKGIIIDEDKGGQLIERNSEGREEIYSVSRGSVIITLTPGYLETLPAGAHTLTAVIMVPERDDMKNDAKFTIAEKSSGGSSSRIASRFPNTGVE